MQAPRLNEAGGLVREVEAACKQGDMTITSRKAQEATGLLKSVPSIGHQDVGTKIPWSEKVLAPTLRPGSRPPRQLAASRRGGET